MSGEQIDSIADTSAIICLSRRDPEAVAVVGGRNFALAFVTTAELLIGIRQARHRESALKKVAPSTWGRQILYPSERAVLFYVKLCCDLEQKGKRIPTNDLWIAALAMERGLPLIARDEHFSRIEGLTVIPC